MTPPTMAGWNLALRFGLELGALAGLGIAAWRLSSGPIRWATVIAVPAIAAVVWGVFNVLDDPSRSGAAPVEVSGWIRLAIELAVLGGAAFAVAFAGRRDIGIVFAALIVFHYTISWSRIEWLVQACRSQPPQSGAGHRLRRADGIRQPNFTTPSRRRHDA